MGVQTRTGGPSSALSVRSNKVDTGDDTSGGTRSIITQNLDSDDARALGNTVGGTGNGTGAVSSVSVEIRVGGAGNSIESPAGTAAKVGVGDQHTSINDVDEGTSSRSVVIDVVGSSPGAVRDGAKSPRRNGRLGNLCSPWSELGIRVRVWRELTMA